MVTVDPRSNPTVGSETISGQLTDKALALLDLLNQATGTEGSTFKTFEIDGGESLSLAMYRTEANVSTPAWQARQIIYFQDSGTRLQELETKLRENYARLQNDITSGIAGLFDLINKPEFNADGSIGGGANAGEANMSIIEEINAIAADPDSSPEDLDITIKNLLTGETAINNLVTALFAKFELDIQRLDQEIFNLLDDGDSIFSNSDDSNTDTTADDQAKYFLSFGNDQPAKIANNLSEAVTYTLEFLQERHEQEHGAGTWDETNYIANSISSKFTQGGLLLDDGLINQIIEDFDISLDEQKTIKSHTGFLSKFSNLRAFLDYAANYYTTSDDQATLTKLFEQDLSIRTPKYFEDQRSLMDILKGKTGDDDTSMISKIFQGAGDKIAAAASGAIQVLSSGFDKLSSSNFEEFVRNNPILMIEHLIEQRNDSTDTAKIASINSQIKVLGEFHQRQLENLTDWLKEKNKQIAKSQLLITKLEEEKNKPETSIERLTEIDDKIEQILQSLKQNDISLEPQSIRTRAQIAIDKLNARKAASGNSAEITAITNDINLLETTLTATDNELTTLSINNGAAIIINKTIANDINSIAQLSKSLVSNGNQLEIINSIKSAYDENYLLKIGDASNLEINDDALTAAINTIVRTQNTHAALYASELLEAGKINARSTTKKLPTPSEDGSLPEDNQITPPLISPTTLSAAVAAIGNQILLKANNLLRESSIPDETWVDDNATILTNINNNIDSQLTSAGAVFFEQLKEVFKVSITSFLQEQNPAQTAANDAKTIYRYKQNINDNGRIGGSPEDLLNDLDSALTWLNTDNLDEATNKIFIDGYNEDDNYFKNHSLVEIKTRLEEIRDGNDPGLRHLQRELSDADTLLTNLQNERRNKNSLRISLIAALADSENNRALLQSYLHDGDNLDQLIASNGLGAIINPIISSLTSRINLLNGSGDGSIANAQEDFNSVNNALTSLQDRARDLLNGNSNNVGINALILNLEDKQDIIESRMEAAGFTSPFNRNDFKQFAKNETKRYSESLIDSDSISNIQENLNAALTTTSLDLNNDGINDFINISNVVDGIDKLADDVSNAFGQKYDKAQILGQLQNAIITKNSLLEEASDPSTSTERLEEINKTLYGFIEIQDSNNIIGIEIGSADDIKNNALLKKITDLKVDATKVLDQELPTDDDDLIDLIKTRKDEFAGFEQQSIKRLILLMFVLSMLEYSDWDYRKQESDPSRYAVV